MEAILNQLWEEKYRPTVLDDVVGNKKVLKIFKQFIDKQEIDNLLLFGRPGGGKTTIAKIMMKKLPCESLFINGSDDKKIESFRTMVKGFVQTRSNMKFKLIVIDEADKLTSDYKDALKSFIETYSNNVRFIFTTNRIESFDPAIISRFQTYNIQPPDKNDIYEYFIKILEKEGVTVAHEEQLQDIILNFAPDMRRIFKALSKNTINGVFELLDTDDSLSDTYKSKLIDMLGNRGKWDDMRDLIIEAGVNDFTPLYRLLFDEIGTYIHNKHNKGEMLITITKYMNNDVLTNDKEINFSTLLVELIQLNYT